MAPEMEQGPVPDYCEPLIGWRAWQVDRTGLLRAISTPATWTPFKKTVARHLTFYYVGAEGRKDCFEGGCDICGVYAVHSPHQARAIYGWMDGVVYGTVALWGRVVIHDRGYRAQFAYPQKFVAWSDSVDIRALSETYGVPYEEDEAWRSEIRSAQLLLNPCGILSQNVFLTILTNPILSWFQARNPPWTSRYLIRPEEHSIIIEPPKVPDDLPGLPRSMRAPEVVIPRYYRTAVDLWLPGGTGA